VGGEGGGSEGGEKRPETNKRKQKKGKEKVLGKRVNRQTTANTGDGYKKWRGPKSKWGKKKVINLAKSTRGFTAHRTP